MSGFIVNFILAKLADATVQELYITCGVDKEIKSLTNELGWIQAFLKDADRMKNCVDERQKHWLKEIREVAYDIEDAIDKASILGMEMKNPEKQHSSMEIIKRIFKRPKTLPAQHELGVEINDILVRIKKISEMREQYSTNNLGEGSGDQTQLPVKQLLIPDFDDPDVVGFEQDTDNIVKKLLDYNTKIRCVVSIVGPGGLGKTTLARKAYNSHDVKMKFDLCIWISISQKFTLVDILRQLVEQIQGKLVNLIEQGKQEKYFHKELYKSLQGKKYLVVLDDVWTEKLWIQIKEAFPDTKNGSRVLMTTRYLDVAKSFDSPLEPYELSYLTEGASLDLFLKNAFPYQEPGNGSSVNLLDLANQFAKKCGGLPLALCVLGGLLSKQPPNEHSWRKVMQKINWSTVLASSYEDLSFALKSCFMYFSIFPEDYRVDAKALIRMWIAEGFIPQNDKGGILEDTAEDFLEDLVQRSMIQVSRRALNGSIRECYIHDLLHEVAIRKAEEENFLTVSSNPDDQKICSGARRLAFHHEECNKLMKDASPILRSLVCFKGIPNISRQRQLKVFSDMGKLGFIPGYDIDSYEVLASFRYLELSSVYYFNYFVGCNSLNFLQTLDLRLAPTIALQESVWHIRTLRHILLSRRGYTSGPPPLVDMRNLQTLGGVKPRLSWKDQGLPNLPSLRELHMEAEDDLPWEIVVTFVGTLKHLETLTLKGLGHGEEEEICNTFKHVCFNQEMYC